MKYYTPKEVAEMLKVSDDTILNIIKAGKLGATRVGHMWRIPQQELDNYLKKRTTKGKIF